MTPYRIPFVTLLFLVLTSLDAHALGWFGKDLNGRPCVGEAQGYGPFDYRKAYNREKKLPIVEQYHFNRKVELLIKGMTSELPGDIDYTLRAFPNHHRALKSMAKFGLLGRKSRFAFPPPECYLQRAEVFAPDDYKVHLIFGIYLHRKHELQRAKRQYEMAVKLRPKSALSHYNLGLLLLDLDDIKGAKKQARLAAKLGYPLKGLKNKIKRMEAKLAEEQTAQKPTSRENNGKDDKHHDATDRTAAQASGESGKKAD